VCCGDQGLITHSQFGDLVKDGPHNVNHHILSVRSLVFGVYIVVMVNVRIIIGMGMNVT